MENRKWSFTSEDTKEIIDIHLYIKFFVSEKEFFSWPSKIYSPCLPEAVLSQGQTWVETADSGTGLSGSSSLSLENMQLFIICDTLVSVILFKCIIDFLAFLVNTFIY